MYETDEKGAISLLKSTPLNGSDPVYTNSKGVPTCPIGTYVIEETEPPTGYNLPDCQGRTFIEVVKPGNTEDGESIFTYHHETYKPITTEGDYKGLGWKEWCILSTLFRQSLQQVFDTFCILLVLPAHS